MQAIWDEWKTQFKTCPIVKVDGHVIRNVTFADDAAGVVKYISAYKQRTIKGNVQIIGERI